MLIFDIRSRGSLQRLVHSCYNSLQQIKNIPCLLSYLYVIWRSPLCLWCRENFQQYSSLLHSGPFHRTKRFTWKFYARIVQFILRVSMKYWENKFPHKFFFVTFHSHFVLFLYLSPQLDVDFLLIEGRSGGRLDKWESQGGSEENTSGLLSASR